MNLLNDFAEPNPSTAFVPVWPPTSSRYVVRHDDLLLRASILIQSHQVPIAKNPQTHRIPDTDPRNYLAANRIRSNHSSRHA